MPTNGKLLGDDVDAAATRLTELAVVLNFPLDEVIRIVTNNYEISVNDLRSGHSAAWGWMHVGKKERKAIMAIHNKAPPPPPSGECDVCGAWHSEACQDLTQER